MNKLNNYFTTNQTPTLQNYTWEGVYKTYLKPLSCKSFTKNFIYTIDT